MPADRLRFAFSGSQRAGEIFNGQHRRSWPARIGDRNGEMPGAGELGINIRRDLAAVAEVFQGAAGGLRRHELPLQPLEGEQVRGMVRAAESEPRDQWPDRQPLHE